MIARKTLSATYDVGYGKPPRHTQFRRGRSGNPHGRPPRDRVQRLKELTLQEAYRGVLVKENGVMAPVTAIQAILRSQVELATSGNIQAQRAILTAVRRFEKEDAWEATLAEIRHSVYGDESGDGTREHEPDEEEWDAEEELNAAEETGGEELPASQEL